MQSFPQLKAWGGGAAYLKQFYAESLCTVTVTHTPAFMCFANLDFGVWFA